MFRRLIAIPVAVCAATGAAFSADLRDCSYLLEPGANGEAECLCAEPIETFSYYNLGERRGDVRVTTNNPYSEEDPYIPLGIGDRVQLQNNSSALLSGPTCNRDVYGKASVVVREVDGTGFTNVSGGGGADLAYGGTCACATLVEQKKASLLPAIPIIGIPVVACLAEVAICDDDPVTPN